MTFILTLNITDAVGIDDDDEETIAIDRKRLRRDSQRKLEKDEPRAKPKRVRVLVEVKIIQLHQVHYSWFIVLNIKVIKGNW